MQPQKHEPQSGEIVGGGERDLGDVEHGIIVRKGVGDAGGGVQGEDAKSQKPVHLHIPWIIGHF